MRKFPARLGMLVFAHTLACLLWKVGNYAAVQIFVPEWLTMGSELACCLSFCLNLKFRSDLDVHQWICALTSKESVPLSLISKLSHLITGHCPFLITYTYVCAPHHAKLMHIRLIDSTIGKINPNLSSTIKLISFFL